MDVQTLEERYLARARTVVSGRAAEIEVVLPDRLPPPAGCGSALAGWWVPEDSSAGTVVLPNPYDSIEVMASMETWVWEVVERTVPCLGERIDDFLAQTRRPPVYWRTLLAPWLVHVVSAIADRWLFCRAAAELVPGRPVLVRTMPDPPADTAAAIDRLRTDAGNAALLATLAPHLGLRTRLKHADPASPDSHRARRASLRDLARALPRLIAGQALGGLPRRRIAIVGLTRMTALDLLRLEGRVRGLARVPRRILTPRRPSHPSADRQARSRLIEDGSVDPLGRLVLQAMPDLLPRSLLEGMAETRRASRQLYGKPVCALVGSYSIDEVQNEFLARCRAAGKRIAFAQHGGMYLQSTVNAQERLELETGTTFLSWGGRGRGAVPTPSPYLERLRDSYRGGTRITIVEPLEPPDAYVLRFAGHPQGNQAYEPAAMLAGLVERLPASRRTHLVLKRFPNPTGPPNRPPSLEALPFEGPRGGAAAWMASSRLTVIPYLDTPFIEALVIGTPTVGLWNPRRWPLLEEVRPILERLREVGVVHADSASAAVHIDQVYDDVEAWWGQAPVRRARADFIRRFAVPGDWLSSWSERLRELRG
jgi:putative transferase (TIGR04331 family)